MTLQDKKILLGISGCIAAYKACYLTRLLIKAGAEVKVVMTESATRFITVTTMETLSGNPVAVEMFPRERFVSTHHISYAQWADLILLAPATGNLIGKIAGGIADDLLTTIVMAKQSDVMIAPAMNTEMYLNPIVGENINRLKRLGYLFIDPAVGELACETEGVGRLAEPDEIFARIKEYFTTSGSLSGRRVLVTAGPTVEKIDPVRFISNFSSGKMGYALAAEACKRGADVTLITGPTNLEVPSGVRVERIETAAELLMSAKREFAKCDILVMAAAVADFRPVKQSAKKISHPVPTSLKLTANPDILAELGKSKKKSQVMVGFALEVGSSKKSALAKLKKKSLNLVVMNDPTQTGIEFGSDFNAATILDGRGGEISLKKMPKSELAVRIFDQIEQIVKSEGK